MSYFAKISFSAGSKTCEILLKDEERMTRKVGETWKIFSRLSVLHTDPNILGIRQKFCASYEENKHQFIFANFFFFLSYKNKNRHIEFAVICCRANSAYEGEEFGTKRNRNRDGVRKSMCSVFLRTFWSFHRANSTVRCFSKEDLTDCSQPLYRCIYSSSIYKLLRAANAFFGENSFNSRNV